MNLKQTYKIGGVVMPASAEDVREIVRTSFPGSNTAIDQDRDRITGIIYWHGFSGLDSGQRNRLVTERVRKRLGLKGINVGFLFPLVPGETK